MVVLNIIVMLLLALFVVVLFGRGRDLIRIPDGCQESVSIRAIACVGIA